MNDLQGTGLGAMLRAARKAKKLSAESLGAMLEPPVKANTITSWERGERKPNYEILGQLSALLEIDPKAFYPSPQTVEYSYMELPEPEQLAEISYFYSRMNESQRDAVLNIARVMVEC